MFSIGNEELIDKPIVHEGSVLRNRRTSEDCILHYGQPSSETMTLGFVTTLDGKAYLVAIGDKLINDAWEVRNGV